MEMEMEMGGGMETICSAIAEAVGAGDKYTSTHDIHSSSLTVDYSLSLVYVNPQIVALCKDLFKQWSNLDDSHFTVERVVSAGITNLLLKVSVMEEKGNTVTMAVRLNGPSTELFINRERELMASHFLCAAGFGAKLLGVFGNGIVQSFIDARTLSPSDIREPKLAAEIAKQLHKFHQVDIPGSKEPQLWIDIFSFFEKASRTKFDDFEKQKTYDTISFKEVHYEITLLKELTDHLSTPVVFAHNDLLCGNVMRNDEEDKLYFIDFEFGSYNYRGFDIGNHFIEYAGYNYDYNIYPNKDEQYHFFRHYLEPERPHEVSDKDLEALYIETSCYALVCHIHWALFALVKAKLSPKKYDFFGYFFMRYNEYKKRKDKCFSVAQSYLSGCQSCHQA